MQPVAVVVDYLATRGLIDKDDLIAHIERSQRVTDLGTMSGPAGPANDIYGWLRWNEAIREAVARRCPRWAELAFGARSMAAS